MAEVPARYGADKARIALIAQSFARLLGRDLVPPGIDPVAALWNAPLVVVAHGTQADPAFFFGNAAALAAFETDVESFTALPSRLSAEPALRDARARFMARVTRDGFVDDYSGWRISQRGRRFLIERGIVWNLVDQAGARHGQAACFTPP
ncbi:MAG: hypothetical protein RIS94_1284 [Pseudomonadota bacterium]|jgi:hypothetical protein